MSLILITGLPGTGKTAVCNELKARGYEAYDADKDHLAQWFDIKTGKAVKVGDYKPTPEFLKNHSRDIAYNVVESLAKKATNKTVFLCGDPANEDELRKLFSQVFALVLDEETIRHRLASRTDNTWGKLPRELDYTFSFQQISYERYEKYADIILDAAQPTSVIVERILEKI